MQNLRTLCAAVVLALALAAPAFAGNIHTGVASPPPPPQPASMTVGQTGSEANGTIHTGMAESESEPEADTVAEIALTLLQSVLSLF